MNIENNDDWENGSGQEFQAALAGVRDKAFSDESLERVMLYAEAVPMTDASWRQGFRNMLITAVPYAITVALAFVIIQLFIGSDFLGGSVLIKFIAISGVLFFMAFLSFLGQMWTSSLQAGKLLLDCGRFPESQRARVLAVFYVLLGILIFVLEPRIEHFLIGMLPVSGALFFLISSFGRLRIYENGIWQYWSLLKWNSIESYQWVGDNETTLQLKCQSYWPSLTGALSVAEDQKPQVDELLKRYCPQKNG